MGKAVPAESADVRVRLTGKGTWPDGYRGYCMIKVNEVVAIPAAEAARLMRDYPQDFELADGAAPDPSVHWPVDLGLLRKPDAPVSVGIILTTFNGLDLTTRGVHSWKPADGIDIRAIVVDNSSTDGTAEWLERNRIPYIQPLGRCGVAQALNFGLEWYQAQPGGPPQYVLVLNNDVELPAGYIPALVEYAERVGGCWVAGIQHGMYDRTKFTAPVAFTTMITGDASAVLLRTSALVEVGGWDERFTPRYGEDEDLMHRFHLADMLTWRLPVPYGGVTGGYEASNAGSVGSISESYRNCMRIYVDKWGDAPRSADGFRAVAGDVIGRLPCNQGSGLAAPEPLKRRGMRAAIIQNGHIGDVLFTTPIAKHLKQAGYSVTWYAVEPYLSVAKLCPYVDEFVRADKMAPGGGPTGQTFERAGKPTRLHAEAEGFDVIIGAQISPENQTEFLRSPLPYARFMYARNGIKPTTLRPQIVQAPQAVADELAVAYGPRGEAKRLLLNLAAESLSLRIDWGYWDALAADLIASGIEVWYSEPPGDSWTWRGKAPVRILGAFRDRRCIAYMAQHVDMVLSSSSAPLFSGFALDVPGICLIPRVGPGGFVKDEGLRKYGLAAQGIAREWPCLDIVLSVSGRPERFPEPRDFAAMVAEAMATGADLRGYHAELYGKLCGGVE